LNVARVQFHGAFEVAERFRKAALTPLDVRAPKIDGGIVRLRAPGSIQFGARAGSFQSCSRPAKNHTGEDRHDKG